MKLVASIAAINFSGQFTHLAQLRSPSIQRSDSMFMILFTWHDDSEVFNQSVQASREL